MPGIVGTRFSLFCGFRSFEHPSFTVKTGERHHKETPVPDGMSSLFVSVSRPNGPAVTGPSVQG